MKESIQTIRTKKVRRARRVRATLAGTAERPRMSVHISNRYVYVQCIDDATRKTLLTVKTPAGKSHVTVLVARALGKEAATKAVAKGISAVIFDRGARKYHGRIKAVAEGAREGGLKF